MNSGSAPSRRAVGTVVMRAAVAMAAWVSSRMIVSANAPTVLRILSYNIRHAQGTDGTIDVPRIAAVIKSVAPDVALLQEVDCNATRSGNVDQAAELGRLTGMHAVFGPNLALGAGAYGNAILARFPLRKVWNRRLPASTNAEPRGVLAVDMGLSGEPGGPMCRVLVTHLDQLPNLDAIDAINDWVAEDGRLVIIGGDFNARPESVVMKRFRERWTLAGVGDHPTFPAAAPTRQIDFIGYRPRSGVAVSDVSVVPEAITSDHRPILATLVVCGD